MQAGCTICGVVANPSTTIGDLFTTTGEQTLLLGLVCRTRCAVTGVKNHGGAAPRDRRRIGVPKGRELLKEEGRGKREKTKKGISLSTDPLLDSRWRRDRDSNPGRALTLAGFQDRCIQPLCHPSGTFRRLAVCAQHDKI